MADLDAVEFGADGREEERGRRRERTETGLDANSIDASASWVAQFNSNETSTDTLRLRGGARGSPPPPGSPGTGIRQLRSGSRASSRGSPSPGPSSPAAKRPGSGAIVVQKTAKDANLENVGKVALTPMVEAVDLSELISRSAKKAYEELASMSETWVFYVASNAFQPFSGLSELTPACAAQFPTDLRALTFADSVSFPLRHPT